MTISTTPTPIEAKIIQAAVECIEKYGIQGTTNRKIAEMAGVNSAAINYYFRSKEALIERCMQVTLENAFDFADFERLPGSTAAERCTAIFDELIAGGLNYPGITRSHFYDVLAEGRYDSLAVAKLNEFVEKLIVDLAGRGAAGSREDLKLACVQITSAVMMAILAPRLYAGRLGLDMNDAETRRRYVGRLVEGLL